MYKRLFTATIIFGAAALAPPLAAQAPEMCQERSRLIEALQETFYEQPVGAGLQNPEQMLEIWSSPRTGSFTVLITRADGISCIVAWGTHWQESPPPQPDASAS
jgi:hypothetical protein